MRKIISILICMLMLTVVFGNIGKTDIATLNHHIEKHPPWDNHDNWSYASSGAEAEAHSSDRTGSCEAESHISIMGSENAHAAFKHQINYQHIAKDVVGGVSITYEVSWYVNIGFNLAIGTSHVKVWLVFFVDDVKHEKIRFQSTIEGGNHTDSKTDEPVSDTFTDINFVQGNTYKIGVEVWVETSVDGAGFEIWSYATAGHSYEPGDPNEIIIVWLNRAPAKPERPDGPTSGQAGIRYTYTTSTTDDDKDDIRYDWRWEPGSGEDWWGPYPSGGTAEATHVWDDIGTFFVKVRARDSFDYYSPWSDPLEVEMPVYYGGGPDDPDPGYPDPGYPDEPDDPDPGYPDPGYPDEPDDPDPGYPETFN